MTGKSGITNLGLSPIFDEVKASLFVLNLVTCLQRDYQGRGPLIKGRVVAH